MPSVIQKFSRPAGLLLVIVLVLLWLYGGRTRTWTTSLDTKAEPATIFRYITEPDLIRTWMTGIEEIDPANSLPPGIGQRQKVVTHQFGSTVTAVSEVVEFEQDRLIQTRLDAPDVDVLTIYIIEPTADGYQVHRRLQLRRKGWSRLTSLFGGNSIQQQLDEETDALAKQLSTTVTN